MKLLFNLRVQIWSLVHDLENILYPYKDREPEIDYYYIIKDDETKEEYTILEWIKFIDKRLERLEDNIVFINNELRKVDKLDLNVLDLKNIIHKNERPKD